MMRGPEAEFKIPRPTGDEYTVMIGRLREMPAEE